MSLKEDLRRRILVDMIGSTCGGDSPVVLILDKHTSSIVSSCCRMFDIMDAGVLALESLEVKRQPLEMEALYFITPTAGSIARLIQDFSGKRPQYAVVHLWFTTNLPKDLLEDISDCQPLVSRVQTLSELNCDFQAAESRVFSLARPGSLARAMIDDDVEVRRAELKVSARQIASLCLTIKEYPYIRYMASSNTSEVLAEYVEAELNQLIAQLPGWKFNDERGTLLIVDRSLDPVAPLLHDLTYQSMVNDLLQVDGEIVRLGKGPPESPSAASAEVADEEGEVAVLSEQDALWVQFRHQHISRVLESITRQFNEFRKENAFAKLQMDKDKSSIKQMLHAMKSLPQYRSLIREYYKHMSIAEACTGIYDRQQLQSITDFELQMVTGLDQDQKTVKRKAIDSRLREIFSDPNVHRVLKMRLLLIYFISRGSNAKMRKRLAEAAGMSMRNQGAILNLRKLGVNVVDADKKPSREAQSVYKERMNAFSDLIFMRFEPAIHDVMRKLAADTLSRDEFPYTKEPPPRMDAPPRPAAEPSAATSSRRKRRGNWRDRSASKNTQATAEKKAPRKATGPRLIVAMIGGACFSEVRAVYEAAEQCDANLILGASDLLTPERYMTDLENHKEEYDPDLDEE